MAEKMKRYKIQFTLEDEFRLQEPVEIILNVEADERTEDNQNAPYEAGEDLLESMGISVDNAVKNGYEVSVNILEESWI